MATDDEVAKKQKDVQNLRDKITAAEIKRDSGVEEANNDVTMAQLEVEEQQLTTQLAIVTEQAKVSVQRAATKEQVAAITGGPEAPNLDPETVVSDAEGNK